MKYTIKDFFESKERLAIKITTLDDLRKICKAFDKEGIMYSETSKYTDKLDIFINCFEEYGNIGLSNCYYLKSYGYCEIDWYINKNYTILTMNDIIFDEEMTVAEYIDYLGYDLTEPICAECYKIKHNKTCDEFINWGCEDCEFSKAVNLSNYLKSIYKPKQEITLTEFEKQFLSNLDDKLNWCARDKNGLFAFFTKKPKKEKSQWVCNADNDFYNINIFKQKIFSFVTWEDKEPLSIEKLKEIANGKSK